MNISEILPQEDFVSCAGTAAEVRRMTTYETKYSSLTDSGFYTLFSTDSWASLSLNDKLEACQEAENRQAAEYGVQPSHVTLQNMEGSRYGYHCDSTTYLNTSMVDKGVFTVTWEDDKGNSHTDLVPISAPNWNVLDTVFHEGIHGIQDEEGRAQLVYVNPKSDPDIYRIQADEKEAYQNAQSKTLLAIESVELETGKADANKEAYLDVIRSDSFQSSLINAMQSYNDPDIEKTLQNVIDDLENGIRNDNPSPSYSDLRDMINSQYNGLFNDLISGQESNEKGGIAEETGGIENHTSLSSAPSFETEITAETVTDVIEESSAKADPAESIDDDGGVDDEGGVDDDGGIE